MNHEIFIYSDIGSGGMTAKAFEDELKAAHAGKGDTIHLRLNSGGGSVFDGIAIFNALKRHPAKKVVHIDSIAASAASLIAMAGDHIDIAESALLMIHNPWAGNLAGNAKELRKVADDLERTTKIFTDAYVGRSKGKLSVKKCRELMDAETWLSASEAVKYGLADVITEPLALAASSRLDKFGYRNAPQFNAAPGSPRARLRAMELQVALMEAKQAAQSQVRRDRMDAMGATVDAMLQKRVEDAATFKPMTREEWRSFVHSICEDRRERLGV